MPHPGILENFQKMEHLPTLPGVALKILEAVRSEETSLNEIADILSKDPPLTAKILGLINSAFYSLPTQVTSISLRARGSTEDGARFFFQATASGPTTICCSSNDPEDPRQHVQIRFW